jgi:class 3 adenylate cyclase/tetratricopeptide (TPR) repeat protein
LQSGSDVGHNRAVECAACGHANLEGNKFCSECGSPLETSIRVLEERKAVTSLFCDLVGFTAASEASDPEDVDRVLADYFRLARKQIEGHGGVVEKFIGDAVVGVFGVPAAREDDPERAVRAALRICEGASGLRGLGRDTLELRVGVNTGTALVRLGVNPASGQGFVTGDAVNTAARLQSAAPVGGVAVGVATWKATSRIFEYEELEPAVLKGKSEPVRVFHPLAPRARMGVDLTRTHDSPFVGRRAELEVLTGAFGRAVANGSVEFVTVVGEPGLGKSRLVGELSDYVDRSQDLYRWRQGRCLPYGEGIAFWALGEIVKAHAGILESDPPELAREKLEQVLPDGEDRSWFRERLLPLVGIEAGSAGRDESFAAWRGFLEHVAADRPTVLVFEDLHWAGEGMIAFLDHLASNLSGVPLLVVSTARPELCRAYPEYGAGLPTVMLTPLSGAESGQLVAGLLEAAMLPAELQQLIRDRAGGNPLFTQEFVALLRDRDLLVQRGPSWELRAGADVPLPDSVQAVIAARLDTLDHETKALLGDAAVIGKVFWAGAVAEMGGRDPVATAARLGELVRRELVAPARRSSMTEEAEYAFGHALVRDVAYEQLPRATRASRHLAAAIWIEVKVGDRVGDFADVLAHHYATALELAEAAGDKEQAAALEAPAIRFLTLAGERALGLDAAGAVASFERALALTPPGHPARAVVLAGFGEAAHEAGRGNESAAALEEALDACRAADDPLGAARVAVVLSEQYVYERNPRRHPMLLEALELLEQRPPCPEQVAVLTEIADQHMWLGEYETAVEVANRALALAADLGLGRPARTLCFHAANIGYLGDRAALDELREAMEIALEAGQGRQVGVIYNHLAIQRGRFQGAPQALETFELGIAFCRARGLTARENFLSLNRAGRLMELGELDEALEIGERTAERGRREGNAFELGRGLGMMTEVLVLRGQTDRLSPVADELEAYIDDVTPLQGKWLRMHNAAQARTALGQREPALALLGRLADEGRSGPVDMAIALGDIDLAERLGAKHTGIPRVFADAALAEARGDLEAAAHGYGQVADYHRRRSDVFRLVTVLVALGRVATALGRTTEAADALGEARPILQKLEAARLLAETEMLLEQLTALSA